MNFFITIFARLPPLYSRCRPVRPAPPHPSSRYATDVMLTVNGVAAGDNAKETC